METPPSFPHGYPGTPPRPLPPPVPRPPRRDRTPLLLAVLGVAIAGLVALVLVVTLTDRDAPRAATTVPVVRPADQLPGEPLDVAGIVAKVQPSVVAITSGSGRGLGVGTGIVLSADGEILTNAHVVGDAETVAVRLPGETEPRQATVVAVDEREDLALVRLEGVSGLTPIEVAVPGDLQVGDDVVAIGFALDLDGPPSVTSGIVSGLDRVFVIDDVVLDGLVQTDADISSGNSGGPLVNVFGQLVGVTTAVARSGVGFEASNIGFAIGLPEVTSAVEQLRSGGSGSTPLGFLGVRIDDRTDGGSGALIIEVVDGAPAARAGMMAGDVVVAVDGTRVDGAGALIAAIRDAAPGDVLRLEVDRAGERQVFDATLVERED